MQDDLRKDEAPPEQFVEASPVTSDTVPAVEYSKTLTGMVVAPDGTRRYFINGAYGREDDLPAVEAADGTRCWYIANPKRGMMGQQSALQHRDAGPAVTRLNGDELHYRIGKLHREDGPAVILHDGTKKWFLNGDCVRLILPGQAESEEDPAYTAR